MFSFYVNYLIRIKLIRVKSSGVYGWFILHLEEFIRVIGSVLDGCHSIQLYFESVIYFGCVLRWVTLGSGRLVTVWLKIGYSSYRLNISSVSVEVHVEFQSVSGCHRLIIGSVLSGTDGVRVFFK